MDFADFIAPLSPEEFEARFLDKAPVHIPAAAGERRSALLDWSGLSDLLAIQSHWGEGAIRLVMNSRPIAPDFYMVDVPNASGIRRLADPGRVDAFLKMGASLVANGVEAIGPAIRDVTEMLGRRFSALTGANVYCSFQDVQAFASHFDAHDVFAVQCVGEKRWNLYANRAVHPLEAEPDGPDAQARIDAAKGRLAAEVRMRPGDLLYLPRGLYHDALASSEASLHLSFAVAPHSGRILFRLLEQMAMEDAAFRAYLPAAEGTDRAALAGRVEQLGGRLSALMRTPGFLDRVEREQRLRPQRSGHVTLPRSGELHFFAPTGRPARIDRGPDGAVLWAQAGTYRLGPIDDALEWLMAQPAVCVEVYVGRFRHHPEADLRAAVDWLHRAGVISPYVPER